MADAGANPVAQIQTLLNAGKTSEAEAVADRLAQSQPSPQTAILAAQVRAKTRGAEAGIGLLQAAALKHPKSGEVQQTLGQLMMSEKRFDEAAAIFTRLVKAAPRDGNLLMMQAMALGQSATPDKAFPIFDALIKARPDMPELHFNRAIALRSAERLAEAEKSYREALRLNADMLPAWYNLANLLIDMGRIPEAFEAYQTRFEKRRTRGANPSDPDLAMTSAAKLRHDAEQFEYLAGLGVLDPKDAGLAEAYRGVLAEIEGHREPRVPMSTEQRKRLAGTYLRIVHYAHGAKLNGPVINPNLDREAIEAAYFGGICETAMIDDLLTPEALTALRAFLNESSVWHQWKFSDDIGYLGARMDDGFSCPLIVQIAEEMRAVLPGIFKHHTLRTLWAFKHSERIEGVQIHADFAAVNVNLYTTPDDANLDPETGGLLVWPVAAPLDWEFKKFNADSNALEKLVEESGAEAIRAPHRQNRAVLFDSDLLHKTDELHFKPGYENRRINVTMLFGRREDT